MNPKKNVVPTLLDATATGGDIAEGGFKFQEHLILAQIPNWLACNGFSEIIREALGDAEARFFLPEIGITREFVEYKNHKLTPSEFWPEVEHFQQMDQGHPGTYHRFTLVCSGVSDILKPMLAALRRVRNAFPFYESAASVQDVSYQAFVETVIKLEKDEKLAHFIFTKVFFDDDLPKAESLAFEIFRQSLEHHIPAFQNLSRKHAEGTWKDLAALVSSRKAKPIRRQELEEVIANYLPDNSWFERPIHIHTISQSPKDGWELPVELQFNWVQFSGGTSRNYPPSEVWNQVLVSNLQATRTWILTSQRQRQILLTGERRLSASLAIGSVFNAVSGFTINFHYREETWATDAHPDTDTPDYVWNLISPDGINSNLAVCLSIIHDIRSDVTAYLAAIGNQMPCLSLQGNSAILSPKHANAAVRSAKLAISEALTKTGAKTLHLFLATPAHFALFLGHRLNATSVIQCYERIDTAIYQPTCCIKAT
ncbi:SAVED domain-containing protein [Nostoc sp. UIC 10607]|uniref:CD-NTase-associated endodeoxyribonuclease Cap4 n=1 Tax=Nostoc sp. UIC 10607 TaxID=3045935 RepID=UPI0039A228A4